MSYNEGDKIICLLDGQKYVIKYMLGRIVVVSSGQGYDMPLNIKNIVPCSPLMEELI